MWADPALCQRVAVAKPPLRISCYNGTAVGSDSICCAGCEHAPARMRWDL